MDVKPLICPACSGTVPLAEGASTKCPFCAADVEIPETIRALRADAKSEVASHADAERGLAQLGSPIPYTALALGVFGTVALFFTIGVFALAFLIGLLAALWQLSFKSFWPTLIVAGIIAILAVPMAWEWVLHSLADKLHVDLVDRLSGFWTHFLLGACAVVFMIVPSILGYHAKLILIERRMLQHVFQSKAPVTPGGPALCRQCSAPLDVPAGALGTRCSFCGTDNLVTGAHAMADSHASRSHKHVEQALASIDKLRASARDSLKIAFIVGLVLMPTCGGLGVLAELVIDEGSATPHSTRASGPPMLYGEGPKRAPGDTTLDCETCDFYVPLQRGQTLSATVDGTLSLQSRTTGRFYEMMWRWDEMPPGPVPHSGWYRLFVFPKKTPATLHWSVK